MQLTAQNVDAIGVSIFTMCTVPKFFIGFSASSQETITTIVCYIDQLSKTVILSDDDVLNQFYPRTQTLSVSSITHTTRLIPTFDTF